MDGILNVDKPSGLTSARAVGRVKLLLPPRIRAGHAGTLDPFATGVLLVLVGTATRSFDALMGEPKTYEAVLQFGATTPTDDPDSAPTPTPGASPPPLSAVEQAVASFVGLIRQKPPAFSALKIGGRRAYDLARRGKPVELAEREVRIDRIELLEYAWPTASLRVQCGRGTYIRALARDLGAKLGVGAYLTALRRTAIGPYSTADSVTLQRLETEGVAAHLLRPQPTCR
jgi:tRNA pseudouridine55 synthase